MVRLRLITLMGDFMFIAYAIGLFLVFFHDLSAPMNALRLWQATPAF